MTQQPLYLPETEVAKLVLGKARASEWPSIAKLLEKSGLPPINPVFGMRYWPGVVKWFERYEKVETLTPGRHSSGKELPCPPGRGRLASNAGKMQTAQVVSIGKRASISESSDTSPPRSG
jgi:hypothetical protein